MDESRDSSGSISKDDSSAIKSPESTLNDLLNDNALKWLFVGGKGGAGKTTMSSSLALRLAETRKSVLLVSIGPTHGISHVFGQKFGRRPTKVKDTKNLSAMELDLANMHEAVQKIFEGTSTNETVATKRAMVNFLAQYPGIEELVAYAEMVKLANSSEFSLVVFDSSSTGHVLKLFQFPYALQELVVKANDLKSQAAPYITLLHAFRPDLAAKVGVLDQSKDVLNIIQAANQRLKNKAQTTFVCICSPDRTSVIETGHLLHRLASIKIDCHRLVVNQLIVKLSAGNCETCKTRVESQKKYLKAIRDQFKNCCVVEVPWLKKEVKGKNELQELSKYLIT